MKAKIEVNQDELTALHNAMLYADVEKLNAIAFGTIVKVEVKAKTAEHLFIMGRMMSEVPADKKLGTEQKTETKTETKS